jgi:pimeloyl-ACP methyl ester carboxylesterase
VTALVSIGGDPILPPEGGSHPDVISGIVIAMKTTLFAAVACLLALSGSAAAKPQARTAAAPCLNATKECTDWVAVGSGGGRSLIYTSYPIAKPNPRVSRALIMIHGTNRNPDTYFATAMAAAFLAHALDDTIVIAPRFASAQGSCHDPLDANEISYSCGGDSWRSGGVAASHPDVTSFHFLDSLLTKLADKKVFPNMSVIVVAGHSAGGQVVARYEMANKVHETLGVPVRYVVSNPSSYAWPDVTRPLPVDDGAPEAAQLGWKEESAPHTKFSYGPFANAASCANFNKWPYGLTERTTGYTAGMSDEQLKKQLVSRPTTYLLSQVDTLPLGGFDSSCSAMAQGATRRARGEAYFKFVNETLGARHEVKIIEECGHNNRCVYTDDAALSVIFPKK